MSITLNTPEAQVHQRPLLAERALKAFADYEDERLQREREERRRAIERAAEYAVAVVRHQLAPETITEARTEEGSSPLSPIVRLKADGIPLFINDAGTLFAELPCRRCEKEIIHPFQGLLALGALLKLYYDGANVSLCQRCLSENAEVAP